MKIPLPKRPSNLALSWVSLSLVILSLGFYGFMANPTPKTVGVYVTVATPETSQESPPPAISPTLSPSADALPAWQEYASPLAAELAESPPRIAIVINGLGADAQLTTDALEHMPPEVTLAFLPYGADLQKYVDAARAKKHEVLLAIPLEPLGDPHPLLTQGEGHLNWILNHTRGYVGVTTYRGALLTTSAQDLDALMEILKEKGLLYLDINETANSMAGNLARERKIPTVTALVSLHEDLSKASLDQQLAALEIEAQKVGLAIITIDPSLLVFDRILTWTGELKGKGISLIPLSATIAGSSKTSATPLTLPEAGDLSKKEEKTAPKEEQPHPSSEPKKETDHAARTPE